MSKLQKLQLGDEKYFSNGPSIKINKLIQIQGHEAEEFSSLFGGHFLFALQRADQLQPTSDLDICGRPLCHALQRRADLSIQMIRVCFLEHVGKYG